jgi:hypothetical protein
MLSRILFKFMLNLILLSVIMLIAVILSAVAPVKMRVAATLAVLSNASLGDATHRVGSI